MQKRLSHVAQFYFGSIENLIYFRSNDDFICFMSSQYRIFYLLII